MHSERTDAIWEAIRAEVSEDARAEPMLANFFHGVVLNHKNLESALSFLLANKLAGSTISALAMRDLIEDAFAGDRGIGDAVRADIQAVCDRDPACHRLALPLLYFKGFHAIQSFRVAHYFWTHNREALALYIQNRMSQVLGVDIHPAARFGCGILIDHATSVVIGETAVIEDDVSMLHEVTLGGTGKETGDRHPKIRRGVLIGTGAKILGNVEIGEGAKIGAGSVVLTDVPPHCTAAGVPAKIIGRPLVDHPALRMDHRLE